MARREKNPNQIIRIDGFKCFMEVMTDAFEIGKVLMRFYKYDETKEKGNKFTDQIFIYMDTSVFNALYFQALMGGCSLMKRIAANAANPNLKEWEKSIILDRGGSERDNVCKARHLKIMKGTKKPVVLVAEEGPGQKNQKGGFTMSGKPTSSVMIAMENEDFVRLLMETKDALIAYHARKEVMKELSFEIGKQNEVLAMIAAQVGLNSTSVNDVLNKKNVFTKNNDNEQPSQNTQGQQGNSYNNNGYNNGGNTSNYNNNGYDAGFMNQPDSGYNPYIQ